MPANTLNSIKKVIYNDPLNAELSSEDVDLLNSLPSDEIASILKSMFDVEKDFIVRSKIYEAILVLENLDTVQFLLDIFEQSPISWQTIYCRSLSKFKDSRAITKLCDVLLKSKDSNMRYVAAESLAEIGDSTAIPALEYAQKNDAGVDFEEFPISDMAREALIKIRSKLK